MFTSIIKQLTHLIYHVAILLTFLLTVKTAHSQDLTIEVSRVATIDLTSADGLLMGEVEKAIIDDQKRVFIVDNGNKQVHYFDSNGQYIRSMGREGRGPGEFMRAVGATLSSDGSTFYLLDSPTAKIVSYDIQSGNNNDGIPLSNAAPVMTNDIIEFNGQIILLGNHYAVEGDAMLHVLNDNGEVIKSFGKFIDFSEFRHTNMGKSQLSIVKASSRENKMLVSLAAPNRNKLFDTNLNLVHEFEDNLLPKPWIDHMIMTPERYKTTFYSMMANSQIISNEHYLYQWTEIIDPSGPEIKMHLELRDMSNGDVLGSYDIPENLTVYNFARIDDQSAYILTRNESYGFEIYELNLRE